MHMTTVTTELPSIQKVTIVGMGAIGGVFAAWLGARLPAGRIQLSALARGQTLAALQQNGLSWAETGPSGEVTEHRVPLHASSDAAALGPQDLVIVSVKGPAMPAVAQQIQPLLAPHTVVLVAMNGVPWWFFDGLDGECNGLALQAVDPGGLTALALPTAHVLGCVVHVSAVAPQPGRVERIKNNQLIIGEPDGEQPDPHADAAPRGGWPRLGAARRRVRGCLACSPRAGSARRGLHAAGRFRGAQQPSAAKNS